jgi:hypothetical protein
MQSEDSRGEVIKGKTIKLKGLKLEASFLLNSLIMLITGLF